MKHAWIALGALLMAAAASAEWDGAPPPHDGNPDRYASVFLGFKMGNLYGSGTDNEYLAAATGTGITNVPVETATANEERLIVLSPSVRFPMTHRLTVELTWDKIIRDYSYTGTLAKFQGTLRGELYGVGVRYYFPD